MNHPDERYIFGETEIKAGVEDVWDAWTTGAGIRSFFAPECNIDIRPDGDFEIFFNPDAPPGEKGGEGLKVMAVQQRAMLSFTWNAPHYLREVWNQKTHVMVRFYPSEKGTLVSVRHDGWGEGGQWDEAFRYFQKAWLDIVLPRLKYRFERGPVDWNNPPSGEELKSYR